MTTAISPNYNSTTSPRRTFSYFWCCNRRLRFSFTAENILDMIVSFCTVVVEKAVLILGPLLICFASVIIGGLSWTFFTILVPMMQRDLQSSSFQYIVIGGHITFVIFLLIEIVVNYFMCVMTRNDGPSYDMVVRELAEITGFVYPETPQEIAAFQNDFNGKMMIRMRRRQTKETELSQRQQSSATTDGATAVTTKSATTLENDTIISELQGSNGTTTLGSDGMSNVNGITNTIATGGLAETESGTMTLRKNTTKQKNNVGPYFPTNRPIKKPTPLQIRNWMLMAPDEWGFCQRTNQPKPPRSHYDHVTKLLVLNLDHYCPWMFNAVGYFNYRYFCNFLWFVELGMMYGTFMAYRPFMNTTGPNYRKQVLEYRKTGVWKHLYAYTPINTERMPISLAFMLCLAVGLAVACLGGFHLYLVLTGQTTIEFHGNWVNRTRAKRLGQKWRNPYDLGWRRNLQQVYGTQPFWWAFLIPSTREPEFLPLPLHGEDGKRKRMRKKRDRNIDVANGMEEQIPLTSPCAPVDIV